MLLIDSKTNFSLTLTYYVLGKGGRGDLKKERREAKISIKFSKQ